MESKIREDYVKALKAKDAVTKSTLSLLISAVDNEKIALRRDLTVDEVTKLISREIKKRNQSIEAYTLSKRIDLAVKEESELKVLESYLPQALTYPELISLVRLTKATNPGIHEGKLFGLINKECKGVTKAEEIKKAIAEA
jgi:uncharacterized protein YqeY